MSLLIKNKIMKTMTKRRYIIELTKAELEALECVAVKGLNTHFETTFDVKQEPRLYAKATKGINELDKAIKKGLKTIK